MAKLAALTQGRWLAPASFFLLLIAYHLIFGQFFPTRNGTLGHDYARILPDLLDGYYWFRNNGIFEPFWFTPAFCGGQPALGAPESALYSVTQFLTLFIDPLASVYATVLLFASLGFWGFYLMLRACFGSSREAAVLGGALFMFNGFFIHRMLIGHFAFHGVMLMPWIAYFLLRPSGGRRVQAILLNGAAAGCLLAYCIYSGMVHLLIPCMLAVLGIVAVRGLVQGAPDGFMSRLLLAVLVAGGLSAAKLVAALLYLQNFPRSDYLLPGVTSVLDVLWLLFSTLFISPSDIAEQAKPLLDNLQWEHGRHEWEYGITFIPLLIIAIGGAITLGRAIKARIRPHLSALLWLALLGLVLLIPLALNFYAPDWNAFLKQLPVIKSTLYMVRWFVVYIPLVILWAALMFDRISPRDIMRSGVLVAALAALVFINAVKDRDFYQEQPYHADTIVNAWRAVGSGAVQPRIQGIMAFLDADGQIGMTNDRNDMIAKGGSQLACNNPIFGYRLEHFPLKSLHLGSVFAEKNGVLNIKNPACYTYPEQNHCAPGDHFTTAQLLQAQAFVNYQPFPFNFSPGQKMANGVTQITLALLVVLFAAAGVNKIRRRA